MSKARADLPRLSHVPQETARDPLEGRDRTGRFGKGNQASRGSGVKALILKGLGDPNDPETAEIVRLAVRMYRGLLQELPADGPAVRQLVAAQARHAVLAGHLTTAAAKEGLTSPAGMKLAAQALQHDRAAERLAVTAYDRAVREQRARAAQAPQQTSLESALTSWGEEVGGET